MNIFIAGLSFKVSDADLAKLFDEYGPISSAKVITDRNSGRSKGYGFVELEDNEKAAKAINDLNETEYEGRTISLSEARPKEERPARDYNGGGNRDGGGYRSNRY
jgi:RNA recognition motif-containing protein